MLVCLASESQIIFIPIVAFSGARAVVIAVNSGYAVKPVRGCGAGASSFRKVCRLTLWPQSEVMALRGGGGFLCVSKGSDCVAVQTQPLGLLLLLDHSTQLTQTRKDVIL